jgi:hypothetical protein
LFLSTNQSRTVNSPLTTENDVAGTKYVLREATDDFRWHTRSVLGDSEFSLSDFSN